MSEQTGRRWQFGPCQYLELSRKLIVAGETLTPEGKLLDVLLELLKKTAMWSQEIIFWIPSGTMWCRVTEACLRPFRSCVRFWVGNANQSFNLLRARVTGWRSL